MPSKGTPLQLCEKEVFYRDCPSIEVPLEPSVVERQFRECGRPLKPSEAVLVYELIIRAKALHDRWGPVGIKEAELLLEDAAKDSRVLVYLRFHKLSPKLNAFDLLMSSFYFVAQRANIYEFDLTQELFFVLTASPADLADEA